MKVITEKDAILARNALLKKGNNLGACAIDMLISDHAKELDTLTVTKLRPMADAAIDDCVLAHHKYCREFLKVLINEDGSTVYCEELDINYSYDDFDGCIPMPIYNPEKE